MKNRILFGIVVVSFLVGAGTLRRGHEWGDDFAWYIMQARSVASGSVEEFVQQSNFTNTRSTTYVGPLAYPWGYPLILVPVYMINGIRVTDYPEVTYRVNDLYDERGVYKIFIEMSNLAENVKYYRGDYVNGLVDLDSLTLLLQTATTGYLDLKKSPGHSQRSSHLAVTRWLPSAAKVAGGGCAANRPGRRCHDGFQYHRCRQPVRPVHAPAGAGRPSLHSH